MLTGVKLGQHYVVSVGSPQVLEGTSILSGHLQQGVPA